MSDTIYKPKPDMIALLRAKLDPTIKPTITAECASAGVARSTYYEWFDNKDFVAWFNEEFKKGMKELTPYLDKVGVQRAVKDFRYWEAMQMKYGNFARREKKDLTTKGEKITGFQIEYVDSKPKTNDTENPSDGSPPQN